MAISTYTQLQSEIAAWLHRANLTDRIPAFIQLCEERMNKVLRVKEMLSDETLSVTSGNARVSLPDRFLQMRQLRYNDGTRKTILQQRPLEMLYEGVADSGTPLFFGYSGSGSTIVINPVPADDTTIIADCYLKPQALSSTNSANDILLNYPSIYLQGSLVEGFRHIRNQEALQRAEAAFLDAVGQANKASIKALNSGTQAPQMPFKRRVP